MRLLFVAESAVFDVMQRQSRIVTLLAPARSVIDAYRGVPTPTHADKRGAELGPSIPLQIASSTLLGECSDGMRNGRTGVGSLRYRELVSVPQQMDRGIGAEALAGGREEGER